MTGRAEHFGIILGSYAAFPAASEIDNAELVRFQSRIRELPHLSGLEIPFTRRGLLQGSFGLPVAEQLGFGWDIVVTALPAQMEHLQTDPHFGLASLREDSREAACREIQKLLSELDQLLEMRPDLRLRAVMLHSGPRAHLQHSSVQALKKSFHELRESHVGGVSSAFSKIVIEHCDSGFGAGIPAKGFLSIFDEIDVAHEFGLGVVINWGRSAIEGRSAQTPIDHLRLVLSESSAEQDPPQSLPNEMRARTHEETQKSMQERTQKRSQQSQQSQQQEDMQANHKRKTGRSLLRGLIYSGASSIHPLYGEWLDSHAPLLEAVAPEMRLGLELTMNHVRESWRVIHEAELDSAVLHPDRRVDGEQHCFFGVKVQPLPREMSVDERIEFLRRHLDPIAGVVLNRDKS